MDTNVVQVEDLMEYVETLELQNNNEDSKLSKLTNDLKKEERRKIEFEVNIDELKRNMEFYTSQVAVISRRLNSGKKIHSQFALATECSRKLNGLYENVLKPQEFANERRDFANFEASEPSQEIQKRHKNIQKNIKILDELLDVLLINKD